MRLDRRVRDRRVGLAMLIAAMVVVGSLAQAANASPDLLAIRGVTITNVTDTGFSVSWVTDSPLPGSGSVDYGTSATALVFQTTEAAPVAGARGDVHDVNVRSLNATTTYYFSVVDAGVSDPTTGYVYRVTTGPTLQNTPTIHWATGQVFQSDGKTPAVGALVTVRVLDNANLNGTSPTTSAPQSGFTNGQGDWTIALSPRSSDNSSVFNYATNGADFLLITAEGGGLGAVYPAQSTSIKLDNSGDVVVPPLTLGGGVNPAETPIAVVISPTTTATSTATLVPTTAGAATSAVDRSTPGSATPTEETSSPGNTATPTRTLIVIPTVVIPTRVVAPVRIPVESPPPVPTLPAVRPPEPPSPSATLAAAPTARRPAAEAFPPGPIGRVFPGSGRAVPPSPAATATVSPTATAPVPPDASSAAATTAGSKGPLRSLTLIVSTGLALVGLGLALSVVGLIDQRRGG
ncbi:MAG: fibronectin type III domain-containing protein [Chloroflexota bacterium]